MKTYLLIPIMMLITSVTFAQSDYYWYKGKKINLTINKDLFYISSPDSSGLTGPKIGENIVISSVKKNGGYVINGEKRFWQIVELKNKLTTQPIDIKLVYSNAAASQIYVAPVIGNKIPVATSELFYVELKREEDTAVLAEISKNLSCQIVKQESFMPLWYEMRAPFNSNGLIMSNLFYETTYFLEVDPGFLFNFQSNACPGDPLFGQQWALHNTYPNGVDIKACNAWDITQGLPGITVAILDQGIDLTDKEFTYNLSSSSSYDLINNSSPSVVYGSHATHVAGIAGANQNNGIQISGVAPSASLMSISDPLSTSPPGISARLANGINYAWQHGAAVINCSWGDQGGAFYNQLHSAMLDNAINSAISSGRGGLGTVVVFAAGNYAPVMDYPANSNPDIEAVGAIDSVGHRASFSGYGNNLDVVAPGVDILSTIPNNGVARESGTSMAAPHVAGVAALILSVNNSLTGAQVRNIIESTSQKVGGYTYQTVTGHPNGTWNSEMGYGLINAYAAVQQAQPCSTITDYSNQTVSTNTTVNGCYVTSHNVTVTSGKLTITSTISTTITPTFTVNLGAQLQLGN